ncbi:Pre-mRNA-processing protein 40C [Diplonema papillatum]|nr:Pre-mRNA-processing protein 40C [Diplonema papillatum]
MHGQLPLSSGEPPSMVGGPSGGLPPPFPFPPEGMPFFGLPPMDMPVPEIKVSAGALFAAYNSCQDPTGRPYYYNAITKESVWVLPPPPVEPTAEVTVRLAAPLPMPSFAPGMGMMGDAMLPPLPFVQGMLGLPPMQLPPNGSPIEGAAPGLPPAEPEEKVSSSYQTVEGSAWRLISNQGKQFWYNSESKQSAWTRPAETEGKELSAPVYKKRKREEETQDVTTKGDTAKELAAEGSPKADAGEGDADATADKKKRRKDGEPDAFSSLSEEERQSLFHSLLGELDLPRFASWSYVLRLIISDKRFHTLKDMPSRRAAFDAFMKARTAQKPTTAPKTVPSATSLGTIHDLLNERVTNDKLAYDAFQAKFRHDPRYNTVGPKERRELFEAHAKALKKKAKENESSKKASFLRMLRAIKNLERNWKRAIAQIDPKRELDIDWEEHKEWFYDFWYDQDANASKKPLSKTERAALALKQRQIETERATRHMLRQNAMLKERLVEPTTASKQDEFVALLVKYVHKSLPYKEGRALIKNDPAYERLADSLPTKEREEIFNEYLNTMVASKKAEFSEWLAAQQPALNFASDWPEVERRLTAKNARKVGSDLTLAEKNDVFEQFKDDLKENAVASLQEAIEIIERQVTFVNKTVDDMHLLMRSNHAYIEMAHDEMLRNKILAEYAGRVPPKTGTQFRSRKERD